MRLSQNVALCYCSQCNQKRRHSALMARWARYWPTATKLVLGGFGLLLVAYGLGYGYALAVLSW